MNKLLTSLILFVCINSNAQILKMGTPDGHNDNYSFNSVSTDEKFIITESYQKTLVWDVSTTKLLYQYDSAKGAAFSDDGKFIYVSYGSTIMKSELSSGLQVSEIKFKFKVENLSLVSGTNYLIAETEFGAVLIDPDKRRTKKFKIPKGYRSVGLQQHLHGKYLMARNHKSLKVLDLYNWNWIFTSKELQVNGFTFVPHQDKILIADTSGNLHLINLRTGKTLDIHRTNLASTYYNSFKFTSGGNLIALNFGYNHGRLYRIGADKIHEVLKAKHVNVSRDGSKAISIDSLKEGIDMLHIWDNAGVKLESQGSAQIWEIWRTNLSNDGRYLVTDTHKGKPSLWDLKDGKIIHSISRGFDYTFINNNRQVIANYSFASRRNAELRDIRSWKLLQNFKNKRVADYSFTKSLNDQFLTTWNWRENTLATWNWKTGIVTGHFAGHERRIRSYEISPDQKYLLTGSRDKTAKIWNFKTGRLLHTLDGNLNEIDEVVFSPNGKYALALSYNNKVKIWDPTTGKLLHQLKVNKEWADVHAQFSDDSQYLKAYNDKSKSATIWDLKDRLPRELGHEFNLKTPVESDLATYFGLSHDENENKQNSNISAPKFNIILDEKVSQLMDANGNELFMNYQNKKVDERILTLSKDSTKLFAHTFEYVKVLPEIDSDLNDTYQYITNSLDEYLVDTLVVYDLKTNEVLMRMPNMDGNGFMLSNTDKYLINAREYQYYLEGGIHTKEVYHLIDGKKVPITHDKEQFTNNVLFNNNDTRLVVQYEDNMIDIWDLENNKLLITQRSHDFRITDMRFLENDKFLLTTSSDGQNTLWDMMSAKPILRQFYFDNDPEIWVHLGKGKFFDASPKAMEMMYWTVGSDIIEFSQLKDRFWIPGLWEKVIMQKPLPDYYGSNSNSLELHPTIKLKHPEKNYDRLGIQLINRGGGYGQVKIKINGKEVNKDFRGSEFDQSRDSINIEYTIKGHPFLKKGELNTVEVIAYNYKEFVASRPQKIFYLSEEEKEVYNPTMYGIIVGTSDYLGVNLDLDFPDKDAATISESLELAAKNLLGTERTNFKLLTTASSNENLPTKANIRKRFKEIAQLAKPNDAVIMYFAGHGTNYGTGEEDFYYITSEAASASLKDPEIRKRVSISSLEITEWINEIAALKQIIIFDACHSGQFAEDLMKNRTTRNTDEIKALERLRDRTGVYVLSGSASDAVSYEASVYGQGLLTYALLFGLKGASLRDEKFVDVSRLFQFAADKVPELAADIGGIQKPEIRIPHGGESFDIGVLNDDDKKSIKLPYPKPLFVRSYFQNDETFEDNLEIAEIVNQNIKALQIDEDKLVYINIAKFSNAYSIKGRYQMEGNIILLKANLLLDGEVIKSFEFESMNAKEAANNMVDRIKDYFANRIGLN
ncbi:MAG: caspase family protein [bacterium]|nr:caspase family protein [bacterium]